MPEDVTTTGAGDVFRTLGENFETLGLPLLFIGLVAGIFIGFAIAKVNAGRKK